MAEEEREEFAVMNVGGGPGGISKNGNYPTTDTAGIVYPSDLMTNDQYKHYLLFHSSKTVRDTASGIVNAGQDDKIGMTYGTIGLYIPGGLAAKYSTNWSSEEMGAAWAAMNGQREEAVKKLGADILTKAFSSATGVNANAGYASAGVMKNDFQVMTFKGVDFRSFSFEFQFAPRNRKESEDARKIIAFFKKSMMPGGNQNTSAFLTYPPNWTITMHSKGDRNKYLFKTKACALNSCDVDYAPNGSWSSFEDGAPTEIKLSLGFQELVYLTAGDISTDGYSF